MNILRSSVIFAAASLSISGMAAADSAKAQPLTIISSLDGSEQRALFQAPARQSEPVPLLVALHTWSGDYTQCKQCPEGWAMVAPNFRGPNIRPQACASKLAIQDVLDAVDYAKRNAKIDPSRIYLVGASGGGHMALMMAAKAPELWAGVSVWVPISDLAEWWESGNYRKPLEAVCGGAPGIPATDAEFKARSPIHFLAAAKGLPLDINAGIHDGHTGSVLISQSLNAFNVLAEANGFKDKQIPAADIEFMTREQQVPGPLAKERESDPERKRSVLFRRVAGPVRITLFEGGHEIEQAAAWQWLGRQQKGSPACFAVPAAPPRTKDDAQQVAR